MAAIKPICALRYNPTLPLDKVLSPPYDIISSQEQEALYNQHPNNCIRIDFGKQFESDNADQNRYTRAASDFKEWIHTQVLVKDTTPGFYVYQHTYFFLGQNYTFIGIIGLLKLSHYEEGIILPHEKTLSSPVTDRLDLMKACSSNFSQIFTLFSDDKNQFPALIAPALTGKPMAKAIVGQDMYQLFKITAPDKLADIQAFFSDKVLFIADGHHRYQTSLNYQAYCRKMGSCPKDSQADYTMALLGNLTDPGLHLLPTHRLCFGLEASDSTTILSKLSPYFILSPVSNREALESYLAQTRAKKSFGLVFKDGFYVAVTKSLDLFDSFFPEASSDCLRQLDVSILHSVILQGLLGLSAESILKQQNLRYTKNSEDVFSSVLSGESQIGFVINATQISEMKAVSESGEVMPQKSTYFYPKLITGLVLNEINPEMPVSSLPK